MRAACSRPSATQPTKPSVDVEIYESEWLRNKQQHTDQGDAVIPPEAKPTAQQAPKPEPPPRPANDTPFPNLDLNHLSIANPFTYSEGLNRVAAATRYTLDTILDAAGPLRLPFSPKKVPFARGR